MPFCNSCGATLTPGTKFCSKCGATIAGVPAPVSAAPPKGGSSALKVILIVVAVIVVIGILGIATIGFIGYRVAKSSRVSQHGDHVKVETPFGAVESSEDPTKAVQDLGIEIYPGAQVQAKGAASATFGGVHTVTANFQTSDSVDKVCEFYKGEFPGASVTTSEQNHCTIISTTPAQTVTIHIEGDGGATNIQVANVTKK
jgi:hypothetical protein